MLGGEAMFDDIFGEAARRRTGTGMAAGTPADRTRSQMRVRPDRAVGCVRSSRAGSARLFCT